MKIRTDFVTNSSSSSFICYGSYDSELNEALDELIKSGCGKEYLDYPYKRSVTLNDSCHWLFKEKGFYYICQKWVDEIWIPENLYINRIDLTADVYPEGYQRSDSRKMNKPEYFWRVLGRYLNCGRNDAQRIRLLIKQASKNNKLDCIVFDGYTDGTEPKEGSWKLNNARIEHNKEMASTNTLVFADLEPYAANTSGRKTKLERLYDVLSYSECDALVHIRRKLNEEETIINLNDISNRHGLTPSVCSSALRKLVAADIIELENKGSKGTRVRIIDRDLLDATVSAISDEEFIYPTSEGSSQNEADARIVAEKAIRSLTKTERLCAKRMVESLQGEEGLIKRKSIADKYELTPAMITSAFKMMEIFGVIEFTLMGNLGVYISIKNPYLREVLQAIDVGTDEEKA